MTIQAWTFLISRNQSIDYETVVAPDFISEAKIRSLLAKVTEEDFTESGGISIREVKGSEVGNFTVVFRAVKARSKDIGEAGNEVLRDPFGREIYWVEGLVFGKNSHEIQYKIGESHIELAHRYLQGKYREFWHEDKLSISHVIDLVEVTSEPDNKFRVLEPLVITLRPQLPEHRLPEKQELKNYKYPPSKLVRNKTSLFRMVLIAITALLLTGIVWKVWSDSQLPSICLYMTQDVPINNPQNQNSSSPEVLSKELKKLKKEHETAWIWLNGSLEVKHSLVDQIKTEVEKQKAIITKVEFTIAPDKNNSSTLNIKNHPIDLAIALLQNKTVTSGKLDATIIEPISQKASSCNAL